MRRNFTKGLMAGAIALAGLGGSQSTLAGTTKAVDNNAVTVNANSKATTANKKERGAIGINNIGGLDLPPIFPKQFGLTPKEYGLRYGNGGSKRSNKLRYSHNAKVKRRNSK